MTQTVYKKGANETIIVLEIPTDAKTNEDRTGIVDPLYAKYRCDKAQVVRIYNQKTGEEQQETMNVISSRGTQKYEVGKMITVDYDENKTNVCSKGIHYFKTEDQAKMFNLEPKTYTGPYQEWYDNGQMYIKCNNVNGYPEGEYQRWHRNGQLAKKCNYVNGNLEGEDCEWHSNGQMAEKSNYVNDEREGEYLSWHENGQQELKCNYVKDKREGEYCEWYDNGQLCLKCNYVNGQL